MSMTIISELTPKIRGYILNKVLPRAMGMYPEVSRELSGKLPRMADFVIWGECCIRTMGYSNGSFIETFKANQGMEVRELASVDVVIKAIESMFSHNNIGKELELEVNLGWRSNDVWAGTASELHNILGKMNLTDEEKHSLPKTAQRLRRRLTAIAPMLRKIGFDVTEVYDSKKSSHPLKVISRIKAGNEKENGKVTPITPIEKSNGSSE